MGDVDEKLRRGFDLLERAGKDNATIGAALLALHGALEDHLRAELLQRTDLSEADRLGLSRRVLPWSRLTELTQQHLALESDQLQTIASADRVLQAFTHGGRCAWGAAETQRYGRFVATLSNRQALAEPQGRRNARRAGPAARPVPTSWLDAAAQRRDRLTEAAPRGSALRYALIGIAALLLVGGCVGIYQALAISGVMSVQPTPTIAPTPTVPPTATPPPVRQARIVTLAGTPGFLHTEPSFTSPTPFPVAEGMIVTLLNQQQNDPDGNLW